MSSPASGVDLDPTTSHTWTLFVDWCSATGHVALPAQPETLAEFLADHPARVGTHRRRVNRAAPTLSTLRWRPAVTSGCKPSPTPSMRRSGSSR